MLLDETTVYGSSLSAYFDGLNVYSNYTVQVRAFTRKGFGPWSPLVRVSTGAPRKSLECHAESNVIAIICEIFIVSKSILSGEGGGAMAPYLAVGFWVERFDCVILRRKIDGVWYIFTDNARTKDLSTLVYKHIGKF